jgi:hypothetical protein
MGYIEIPTTVPGTKRAVISLWFRVPGTTLSSATAAASGISIVNRTTLQGIIPLVTFGPKAKQKGLGGITIFQGEVPSATFYSCDPVMGSYAPVPDTPDHPNPTPAIPLTGSFPTFDGTKDKEIDPSYIGIDCAGPYPMLSVNIVMPADNKSKSSWISSVPTGIAYTALNFYDGGFPCASTFNYSLPGGGTGICFDPITSYSVTFSYTDTDDFYVRSRPEVFRLLPDFSNDGDLITSTDYNGIRILPDHWHHLILSFDFTNACVTKGWVITQSQTGGLPGGVIGTFTESGDVPPNSEGSRTSSACKMWVALDDKNYVGNQLSKFHPSGYGDQNAILTVAGFVCASTSSTEGTYEGNDCQGNTATQIVEGHLPRYSYSPANVPFDGGIFGFPAASAYVANVHHVEMGEFQMYLGASLDTGKIDNRRAFITSNGTPASISAATKLIGKKADVLLHGAGNWKKGRDTGTLASRPLSDGVHVGDIKTYRPNPNLNKNQGIPQ